MKISIIVAIYNIEDYIDECVASIISQSYDNFELILVNDGSTDNSQIHLDMWVCTDSRVKIVKKQNAVLSSARNEVLKYATGDYILFVDGDDWLDKDALQSAQSFILNNGEVDMLCFDYCAYYTKEKTKVYSYKAQQTCMDGYSFFEKTDFKVTAWSKFYKKTYLDKVGLLFLKGRLHEDISYTVPLCLCAQKVGWINKPLYFYRQNREGSIMRNISYKNVLDFSHAICFDYYFLKEKKRLTPYFEKWVMNSFYCSCFSGYVSLRTLVKAMQENKVLLIASDLGQVKFFWIKLAYNHLIMRIKTELGIMKRKLLKTV